MRIRPADENTRAIFSGNERRFVVVGEANTGPLRRHDPDGTFG
jgi:hypothetical protein